MSPDHDRPRDAAGRFVAVEGTAWVRRWDGRWRECVALFGDDHSAAAGRTAIGLTGLLATPLHDHTRRTP